MTPLEDPIYRLDDLVVAVPVTFDPGSPITTLLGTTVQCFGRSGNVTVQANSVVVTAAVATVTFADGTLAVGNWIFQVVVTSEAFTQTVAEFSATVKESFRLPAF